MRIKRKTFFLSLLVVAILASFAFAHEAKSRAEERIYDRVTSSTIAAREPAPRKRDSLDAWLHKLMLQESGGRTTFKENGGLPYIIDVNGKRSYSCLMFQEGTFYSYSKKYGIEGDITDCKTQKKLARAMILDNPNNWRHWRNSVVRYGVGYPPGV